MEERLTTDQAVAGSSPATDAFASPQKATGRIELPTLGLQDQCSATELSRPPAVVLGEKGH